MTRAAGQGLWFEFHFYTWPDPDFLRHRQQDVFAGNFQGEVMQADVGFAVKVCDRLGFARLPQGQTAGTVRNGGPWVTVIAGQKCPAEAICEKGRSLVKVADGEAEVIDADRGQEGLL